MMSIRLLSSDNEEFVVRKQSAEQSVFLETMISEGAINAAIPLPNVTAKVLQKVIEWCDHHCEATTEEIDDWDKAFLQVEKELLFDMVLAANYLEIKSLMDAGCRTVSHMIKGKSVEEIQTIFNCDVTPGQKAQIVRENEWNEDRKAAQ